MFVCGVCCLDIYVSAMGLCRPENSDIQKWSIIVTVIFDAIEYNFSMALRMSICHPAHFWSLMPDKKMQYDAINYQNWYSKLSVLLLLLFFIINIILLLISSTPDKSAGALFSRLDQMFSDAFSRDHQLIRADPKHSLYLACALMVRGSVELSDIRRNIDR